VSIIYEALQKTQVEDELQNSPSSQAEMTKDDWIDVGISLIIAFLLAMIMIAHYPPHSKSKEILESKKNSKEVSILDVPDETVKPVVQPTSDSKMMGVPFDEAAYKLNHVLNGVFVSEEEKIAMVNNRFFNIGDNIDGMKVVSIEPDKIKLQHENGIVELKIVV
jgi:type II secretory pathway component PulC